MVMGRRGRGCWFAIVNSFNHVLQQGVCGWVTVAMLNVVETEGTQVELYGGVLDRAGQVCTEVAKSEG